MTRGRLVLCFTSWVFGLFGLPSCAPWHDFFQRDQPEESAIRQALATGGPSGSDVAVVLGCPADEDGSPSLCQRCRVLAAVRSYRRGLVRALIFSGGAAHNRWVEGEVMARLARHQGVPEERIFVEGWALTTWQNLRFAQRIMAAQHFGRALLISTAAHLPRARRFAEYYGIRAAYLACDWDLAADPP